MYWNDFFVNLHDFALVTKKLQDQSTTLKGVRAIFEMTLDKYTEMEIRMAHDASILLE